MVREMARKEIRHKLMLQLILEQGSIPPSKELATRLNVTERTIRNDLQEISKQIPKVAVEDIRRKVMLQLRKAIPKMKVHHLIRLAEFFLAKQVHVESKSEVKVDVGKEISGILRDYDQIIEEVTRHEAGLSKKDSSGKSVDSDKS